MNELSECELIVLLRQGSQQAFNTVYDMYARRLLALCYRYTRSREDAEEIVQETFIRLWTHRAEIASDTTLMPLLFTIARHRLVDMFRKRVYSVEFEDYLKYRDKLLDTDVPMDYDHYMDIVRKSTALLPPVQRQVVVMARLEGVSVADIARRLSITEKTVRNQLSLGSKRLHAAVERILKIFIVFYFLAT